jgi:putative thioredoxin
MIDISLENFEAEVIEASFHRPVVVDFWAEWCGPCKALGPVLERLETAYGGRFTLAKIESDREPQLAQAFGVRSIPTVIIMKNGQPVDGFVGALPEGQIRQFLDRHVPSEDELESAEDEAAAEQMLEQGDAEGALAKLRAALAADPGNLDARFDLVKLLLDSGQLAAAKAEFAPVADKASGPLADKRLEALALAIAAHEAAAAEPRSNEALRAAIAANKRDFDARLALARRLWVQGDAQAAMDELLEIILRDKSWGEQIARRSYVAVLELLTKREPKRPAAPPPATAAGGKLIAPPAPPPATPQDPLIAEYRRKLSMALF